MSEPVAKPRSFGEPHNPFDVHEIERRMRESAEPPPPPQPQEPDPLAELARLVGHKGPDPFAAVFAGRSGPTVPPPSRGGPSRRVEPQAPEVPGQSYAAAQYQPEQGYDPRHAEPQQAAYAPQASGYDPQAWQEQAHHPQYDEQAYDPAAYAQQAHVHQNYAHQGYAQQGHAQQSHAQQSLEEQAYGYQQEYAQPHDQQGYYPEDAYAQAQGQGYDASWAEQGYDPSAYAEPEPPRRRLRALLLIGAAAVVMAGGVAGAFVLRGPGAVNKDAPVILASAGPTKVQPAQQASDGPRQTISVLERGPEGNAQSKVVQNEEQPVDIDATARISGVRPRTNDAGAPVTLAPPAPPPVANSIFAEPKRVKAVSVRPDGTIVDAHAPAPAAAPAKVEAVAAPATPAPAPAPAARPNDIASLVAATTPSATPPAAKSAPTRPAPAPKPTVVASVAHAAAPALSGATGSFAVQLAGTTSAEEARDAVERLTRRFSSELGGYKPAVVKAEVGSKTIYRVRVRSLTSDDANTLCARLKAGGGSCFIARD